MLGVSAIISLPIYNIISAPLLCPCRRYEEFTNALISLVHKGLSTQLSNAPGGAEQVRLPLP